MSGRLVAAVLAIAATGCGNAAPSVPPPGGPPTGSLLVLETRPCNWLRPPDPNKCDPVGLARIGLDGELIEELTPELPIPMRPFALSHDGSTIAWAWNWELAVMKLDGSPARIINQKLTAENMGETILDPTWSPDGSELLYRWVGVNNVGTWYRITVDSGEPIEVPMPVDCAAMAWSPDGRQIACEVWAGDDVTGIGETDIFLVDLETLDAEPITTPGDGASAYRPAWSPDGAWLAVAREAPRGAEDRELDGIWLVDVAEGNGRQVMTGTMSAPSWSPDTNHLVAYDNDAGGLVIVGRDGSDVVHLEAEPRQFVGPRWLPEE
jgi:hypothetical protein